MSNFQLIVEGLGYGMTLTILLGPIFIALTQTGIEKGLRAGAVVGLGIWTSDIIIITLLYLLIGGINESYFTGNFTKIVGSVGGIFLMVMGVASFKKKVDYLDKVSAFDAKSIQGLFIKGFMVNTINPFTFIFWTTLMTTYVANHQLTTFQVILFFGSIIGTIMVTDLLKVFAAKHTRKYINESNMSLISRYAGMALIIFGVILLVRSWT